MITTCDYITNPLKETWDTKQLDVSQTVEKGMFVLNVSNFQNFISSKSKIYITKDNNEYFRNISFVEMK